MYTDGMEMQAVIGILSIDTPQRWYVLVDSSAAHVANHCLYVQSHVSTLGQIPFSC